MWLVRDSKSGLTRPLGFQQPLPCREGAVGFSGSISRLRSPDAGSRLAIGRAETGLGMSASGHGEVNGKGHAEACQATPAASSQRHDLIRPRPAPRCPEPASLRAGLPSGGRCHPRPHCRRSGSWRSGGDPRVRLVLGEGAPGAGWAQPKDRSACSGFSQGRAGLQGRQGDAGPAEPAQPGAMPSDKQRSR